MTRDDAVSYIIEKASDLSAYDNLEVEVEERRLFVVRLCDEAEISPYRPEFIIVENIESISNVDAHRGFMWLTQSEKSESMVRGALNRLLR